MFAPLFLTDRSQPDCRCCSCGQPSPRSSQDGRHLWLWSTRELPQHWHRGLHMHNIYIYISICISSTFVVLVFAHYLHRFLWLGSGWADLQCRRHHTCVWWHGRRWLLLRKYMTRIWSGLVFCLILKLQLFLHCTSTQWLFTAGKIHIYSIYNRNWK